MSHVDRVKEVDRVQRGYASKIHAAKGDPEYGHMLLDSLMEYTLRAISDGVFSEVEAAAMASFVMSAQELVPVRWYV